MNKEKLRYSIYPVELYNLLGKKEHVLSIIYIYNNDDIYLSKISSLNTSFGIKIISVLIFFYNINFKSFVHNFFNFEYPS